MPDRRQIVVRIGALTLWARAASNVIPMSKPLPRRFDQMAKEAGVIFRQPAKAAPARGPQDADMHPTEEDL